MVIITTFTLVLKIKKTKKNNMKIISTLILSAAFSVSAIAQTTITNGGFENWGNTVPASDTCTEPTNWYSDLSGSSNAMLGIETCFKSTTAHSGSYCVKVVTEKDLILGGLITEYINGVVTTGVVNAPTTSKTDGYIGTINYSSATDIRRMSFTGQPDSLVGWYQYTPSSTSPGTERGKVRAILHIGNYFDPETPTTNHPACIDSQVASALFLTDTPGTTVSTWTRFSVPFTYSTGLYASGMAPQYIMINVTPSANQNTNVAGSTLLLDDLEVVYNPTSVSNTIMKEADVNVYAYEKTVFVNFINASAGQSVITIMDITGKKVFSQSMTNEKLSSYNLSDLNTGVYI